MRYQLFCNNSYSNIVYYQIIKLFSLMKKVTKKSRIHQDSQKFFRFPYQVCIDNERHELYRSAIYVMIVIHIKKDAQTI
jgi:hypothetical protein